MMGEIDLDRPYRLKDILPLAYPGGEMTVSGLRREIAKVKTIIGEKTRAAAAA